MKNDSTEQYYAAILLDLHQHRQRDELFFVMILIGVVLILVIILLWFIDVSFAKPISRAIRTAQQVAKGDLNERIQIDQPNEFGVFADAFNLMLERLAYSQTKLESMVTELQDEIRHREYVEQAFRMEQQALAAAISELESFSYSVSHDLRSPLRAIAGFAAILKEDYSERLDEQGKNHLVRISEGAARLGLLINELLKLSRVNRINLTQGQVNLSDLAQDVITELRAAEPEHQVKVIITPGITARGDGELLRSALANLLGNAWKYSHHTLHPYIEFGVSNDDAQAPEFYVRDNGIGFDMEHAKQLFQPFHRLHTNDKFEGSGIGLATVERIIRRHGGRIWARPNPIKVQRFDLL